MIRRGQVAILLFGTFLTLALLFATPVTAANDTQPNGSAGEWVQWTANQTIDSDVSEAALSHVDGYGQMHVGYLTDSNIRYAEVTLTGTVGAQTQIQSAVGTIEQLHVTSPAPGVAHIVWKQENSVDGGPAIQYAVVENGSMTANRTLVSSSNPETVLDIEDVEADTYGRTHILFERVQTGTDLSNGTGSIEDHVIRANGTLVQSVTVAEDGSYEVWGQADAELALRPDRAAVTFSRDYFQYTPGPHGVGVEIGDDVTSLAVRWYANSPPGLTERGTQTLASERYDPGEIHSSSVGAAAMHPEGYLLTSARSEAENSYSRETVFLVGEQRGVINESFVDGAVREPLWDDNGTLYARTGDSYTVWDTDGGTLRQSGTVVGFQDWAVNAEGYPSMLRLVDGELQYQAMVTQTAREYPTVYDRAESGSQAQATVIATLESRVATLEEQLNQSGVTIEVTVQSQGEAFTEGESATVTVGGSDVVMEDINILFAGETFHPDRSGQATIPLSNPGTQELTVQYRGQSVTQELDVRAAESGGSQTASKTDTLTSASGGTAVLNILIPILAIVIFAMIVQRRRPE